MVEKFRFSAETVVATKSGLEPLRLRSTSRCASRGWLVGLVRLFAKKLAQDRTHPDIHEPHLLSAR